MRVEGTGTFSTDFLSSFSMDGARVGAEKLVEESCANNGRRVPRLAAVVLNV